MNVSVVVPVFTYPFPISGDRATGLNPADATTYFAGKFGEINPSTTAGIPVVVSTAGIVIAAYLSVYVSGTLGTTEQATFHLRVNNTTDNTLSSVVQFNAVTQRYNITGLNVAIARGDTLLLKMVMPTWVTNPTAVTIDLELTIAATP